MTFSKAPTRQRVTLFKLAFQRDRVLDRDRFQGGRDNLKGDRVKGISCLIPDSHSCPQRTIAALL